MNAKKIFKTILGVGTLVGTAYVAYSKVSPLSRHEMKNLS